MTKSILVLAATLCASSAQAVVQNWKCTGQLPIEHVREVLDLTVSAQVPLVEGEEEVFTEVYTVYDLRHSDQAPAGRYTVDYSGNAYLIQRTLDGSTFSMFHPWAGSTQAMKRFTVNTENGAGTLHFPAVGEEVERNFELTCHIPAHRSPIPQN